MLKTTQKYKIEFRKPGIQTKTKSHIKNNTKTQNGIQKSLIKTIKNTK